MFIIPTTSEPNQSFKCTIPVDGENIALIFNIRYNSQAGYWVMTLTDNITGKMLVDSIPLITGEYPGANLLEQYAFLNIGSATIVKSDPDIALNNPDDNSLGTGFQLVWGDTL